jgi:dTDP-4-amino-4,6-dideoxygalactose transaminase
VAGPFSGNAQHPKLAKTGSTMTKSIKSAADLAINGAPPLFAEPVHVGRPNIGDRKRFNALADAMFERRWLSNDGPLVKQFEKELCSFLKVKHCIAMCNGTIALEIAIRALDLRGEVIVPSYTFIATAHALQWQEITPVFADIDPVTQMLDPASVSRMITPRTTGILAVHLWGRPAPVEALQAVANEHGLKVMYDASHGFSCTHGGVPLGNFGECEVFSFHATKFFNTFEGGAIVTNNDALAEKMRLMRHFGFAGYDKVIYPGTNGTMAEICAAMGLTNLADLETFVGVNRTNYRTYDSAIKPIPGLELLQYDETERNNYQYIVVDVKPNYGVARDVVIEALHAENVLARRYFWPGCHNMEPYRSYYPHAGLMLSKTNEVAARVLVLPSGTSISTQDIDSICGVLGTLSTSKEQ